MVSRILGEYQTDLLAQAKTLRLITAHAKTIAWHHGKNAQRRYRLVTKWRIPLHFAAIRASRLAPRPSCEGQ